MSNISLKAFAGLMFAGSLLGSNGAAAQDVVDSYAAKMLCNSRADDAVQVVSGRYRTVVNIYNPHDFPVDIDKKASRARPMRGTPQPSDITRLFPETLAPMQSMGVDCEDVKRMYNSSFGAGTFPSFFDGFLVVLVPSLPGVNEPLPLDVRVVHTAEQTPPGDIETLNVKDVNPTRITLFQPVVDLIPLLINAPTAVSCPGGAGSCVHGVDYRISNVGNVAAGAFTVRVSTDNGLVDISAEAGLGAGLTVSRSVTLGPGSNCYNPDCVVTVEVDVGNTVPESNEGNNVDTRIDAG